MDHFSINVPVQERVWKVLTAQNTSFSDSLHSRSAVCGRHLSLAHYRVAEHMYFEVSQCPPPKHTEPAVTSSRLITTN